MVRSYMVERYGDAVYEAGYSVITTVSDRLQTAANEALQSSVQEYDRRHGYRGPEQHYELPKNSGEEDWRRLLQNASPIGGLQPAIVVTVRDNAVTAYTTGNGLVQVGEDGLKVLTKQAPKPLKKTLRSGDLVRLQWAPKGFWRLAQLPEVEGALVALDPNDGAIQALVGGFDFSRSKFNRVTQGHRQPGSGFKPFIYSAALDAGYTAASIIDDAPIEIWDPSLDDYWRPENYTRNFRGPTRLRVALAHSRNLVSIRLLQGLGMDKALRHIGRFGFDVTQQPRNLSLALGTGSVTPLGLAAGYSVFANGGYRVFPYFVQRVENDVGEVIMQARPPTVCENCNRDGPSSDVKPGAATDDLILPPAARVISSQNAWVMTSMMQDVIRVGTAKAAKSLNRVDLAGKTGTTNDQKDAWFTGFNNRLVASVWMGFDQAKPLGDKETGAHLALPMWMKFMRTALDGMPQSQMPEPDGIVRVRIDPETGYLTTASNPRGLFEYFSEDSVPTQQVPKHSDEEGGSSAPDLGEQLF
jgi:penicillin-binding protein 1A